jgi:ligand-binding sensor protein
MGGENDHLIRSNRPQQSKQVTKYEQYGKREAAKTKNESILHREALHSKYALCIIAENNFVTSQHPWQISFVKCGVH